MRSLAKPGVVVGWQPAVRIGSRDVKILALRHEARFPEQLGGQCAGVFLLWQVLVKAALLRHLQESVEASAL